MRPGTGILRCLQRFCCEFFSKPLTAFLRNFGMLMRIQRVLQNMLAWLYSPHITSWLGEPVFWLLGMRSKGTEITHAQIQRILLVQLDEIGDVVMTTPLFRAVRQNFPDAWITLVVKPAVVNLVERCPYLNEILAYRPMGPGGRCWRTRRHVNTMLFAAIYLWRRRFDLVLLPRWDVDYTYATFLAYLSGAPWRVGYSEYVLPKKQSVNAGYDLLLTHVITTTGNVKHEVERNLDVLRFLHGKIQDDALELWVGEDDEGMAENTFAQHGIGSDALIVGLGPSSGTLALKQWPLERFVEIGRWLQITYDATLLVIGDQGDIPLGRTLARELEGNVINMAGKTSLRQTAALLRRCSLFVGNDTGPMHIAAALKIPVIALFGPSCAHRFSPWGAGHQIISVDLPCKPCHQDGHLNRCRQCRFDQPYCMTNITVDDVKATVREMLAGLHVRE
ncbi:hypothetical protein GF339_05530 [candidate division KSB3 bacterium]|uniref:Lipopolysaccharide heptosyltransferase II n=1 Tax=candidate division KSB3 bacterium TaxID=2044937 RepID=A0A9D5JTL9_9BACT|nr:hypothetical protein [candidate division KSB3 bacterium]MBD3324024.1 hypothetical protein [candidate division KSB3 bacterium]